MTDLEIKSCHLELKLSDDEGPGTLEGYCAIFDNVDLDNEVIVKGAFSRTLPDFKMYGFLADGHDVRKDIGSIIDAYEDDKGLKLYAQFFSTPDAQVARQKLQEKIARGRPPGMSIGYRVRKHEVVKGVRHLKDIDLIEASLVTVPANPMARVAAVKSADLDESRRRAACIRALRIRDIARQWATK